MSDASLNIIGGTVQLRRGAVMPRISLGTWPMDDAEAARVIPDAVAAGYRSIDTAENYRNEVGVGKGIAASGIARADLFVTSKLNKEWHSVAGVRQAYEASLERLGLDYLDLFLIHWPNPQQGTYVDAWQGLVELFASGAVRAIGVSNFTPTYLGEIVDATGEVPDLNQVQISPRILKTEVRAFDASIGVVTQSWSPIGQGNDLLGEKVVQNVAAMEGCTPAQAVLAWHLQQGLSLAVKSSDPQRLRENLAAASVTLSEDSMAALSALDGRQEPADPETFGH